jgi:hypothetical protein
MSNEELRIQIDKLRGKVNELWKERHCIKHKSDLEIDLKYRAKMERQLCIFFLTMARKSTHKDTRRYGKKLYKLIQTL